MISTYHRSTIPTPSSLEVLLRLTSAVNPGLMHQQFQDLFVRCRDCQLYMTRPAAKDHDCVPRTDVIDLTNNEPETGSSTVEDEEEV